VLGDAAAAASPAWSKGTACAGSRELAQGTGAVLRHLLDDAPVAASDAMVVELEEPEEALAPTPRRHGPRLVPGGGDALVAQTGLTAIIAYTELQRQQGRLNGPGRLTVAC